jgi:hypothetical protein
MLPQPWAAELAGTDDAELLAQRCTECHHAGAYTAKTHTRLAWHLVVLRMEIFHGAALRPGDQDRIVGHLSASRPAPAWRVVFDWAVLAAMPAAAVLWTWRRRRRRRPTDHPSAEAQTQSHDIAIGENRHG